MDVKLKLLQLQRTLKHFQLLAAFKELFQFLASLSSLFFLLGNLLPLSFLMISGNPEILLQNDRMKLTWISRLPLERREKYTFTLIQLTRLSLPIPSLSGLSFQRKKRIQLIQRETQPF